MSKFIQIDRKTINKDRIAYIDRLGDSTIVIWFSDDLKLTISGSESYINKIIEQIKD